MFFDINSEKQVAEKNGSLLGNVLTHEKRSNLKLQSVTVEHKGDYDRVTSNL